MDGLTVSSNLLPDSVPSLSLPTAITKTMAVDDCDASDDVRQAA